MRNVLNKPKQSRRVESLLVSYTNIYTLRIMENSGIKKTYGKITVDNVKPDEYKKNLGSAQLRQTVIKSYPTTQVSNNMSDSLFSIDSFDLEGGKEYSEDRVTWISVPLDATVKQVEDMLSKCADACIYKVLSHEPILTSGQEYALEQGLKDLSDYENSQRVCDNDGNPIADANGAIQFSAKFFSKTFREDQDRRTVSNPIVAPVIGDLAKKA